MPTHEVLGRPLRPGPPKAEKKRKGRFVLTGGPNESIKVGQMELTNARPRAGIASVVLSVEPQAGVR